MSFTELSHTADVRVRVRAGSLPLLFSDAFLALMQTVFGTDRHGSVHRQVRLEAGDAETLLLDFLSEALFICEVEGLVFSHAEVVLDGTTLSATLNGEAFDPARHSGGTEVKGISYSGLAIAHDANGYEVDILFDV
jgi:SHS2 domain-containing protein